MKREFQVTLIIILTGSVFITSGNFVNATNSPKYYFVVATLLVGTAITAIHKKKITFDVLCVKSILWGISIICFLQACYGLIQFVDWLPSNHSKFAITGSFDNPAGFAAVLAMSFPIGLFLQLKAKKIEKYLTIIILMVITIAVFLSESRTGILAIIISLVVFLLFGTNVVSKFRQYRYYKLITVLILFCLVFGVSIFYHKKKRFGNWQDANLESFI